MASKLNLSPQKLRLSDVYVFMIHCLLLLLLFVELFVFGPFCIWSLFCCAVLSVISSIAIVSLGKREMVA